MREIKVGTIYRHFKGNLYKVLLIANDTEEENKRYVIYESLKDKKVWAREYNMFNSKVDHLKYTDVTTYYRVLVASSYCPVVGNVWNWDCGAKTENVVWDNIKISRSIGDDITEYRKDSTIKYDFYPDTDLLRDGYSQGAFASSFEYGTRKEDGKYKSGNTYKKGDKYLIQNVCYTNKW